MPFPTTCVNQSFSAACEARILPGPTQNRFMKYALSLALLGMTIRESGDRRGKSLKLDSRLRLSGSRHVLRALFQDCGHFQQRLVGVLVDLAMELIESCGIE